ncbi:regulator of G-protein signaling loco [Copidosoma floridanum]|uniref:regulator of G-protein signaling loco n=1 Tax=Copidosoma floridanum TaxID=29053 RepID=UPI000C6FC999|nr:regulator of G-protein signaling loco [Copidosoma floridanum]
MFDSSIIQSTAVSNPIHRWDMSSPLPPPPPPASRKPDSEKIVHRTVLGYLGTIDIPSHLQSVSMMSLVRKCIKRIKSDKRDPTTVLLTIHVANIKLAGKDGRMIAEYPSYRIVYCNSFSNEDKLHFGILTKSPDTYDTSEDATDCSTSCHVFKIYFQLTDHAVHANASLSFGFACTKASELENACQEFPASCDGLLGAIQTLYISDGAENEASLFNDCRNLREKQSSPQPSNVSSSTAHSSNSDSGIGFKDDYGCYSDRNFVEYRPKYHDSSIVVSSLGRTVKDAGGSKLTVRAISDPRWSDFTRPFGPRYSEKAPSEPDRTIIHGDRHSPARCSSSNGLEVSDRSNSDHYFNQEDRSDNHPKKTPSPTAGGRKARRSVNHNNNNKERRRRSAGEGSIVSCPAVPSGRFAQQHQQYQQQCASLAALSALARNSPPDRLYTSSLVVGTLRTAGAAVFATPAAPPPLRSQLPGGMQNGPPDRLSPKVYPSGMGYSMENLKTSPGSKSLQEDHCNTTKSLPSSHKSGVDKPKAWGSLQEIRKVEFDKCEHGSTESCDKPASHGVHTWAISFEKLLEDPKGLQIFAKYLKKEISHENIYFWAACERYADTGDAAARKKLAEQIYRRHLSSAASEPVNVDSHATGQITPELLASAPPDLFAQAQKQIFNLMKFDSYPRFLRSDIYRACLENGCDNDDTSADDGDLVLTNSPSIKLKKSLSDAEDRRRKSILPWHRKNRSKSKDRGELEYNNNNNNNSNSSKTSSRGEKIYKNFSTVRDNYGNHDEDSVSISSSRSSLASWDLALRQSFTKHPASSCDGQSSEGRDAHVSKCAGLCRVILPDGSTTVIPTNHSDSVRDVVTRLLDKRALRYSNYDVLVLATDEIINLKHSSSVLASQEVEVVPSKIIKVELPSHRVVSIVAHKGKTIKEVLKPLLNKYGFKLDLVTVRADGHPVSVDTLASNAPLKLTLTSNNKEVIDDAHFFKTPEVPRGQPTLDEITNKVFEELRVGKIDSNNVEGDEGSYKSDDQKSDSSSIFSNKLFSKESGLHVKKKSKSKNSNMSDKSGSDCGQDESHRPHPPLIAKWRNGVKLQLPSRFDGDGKNLYEGLKRAQRTRLEDQRGTEINFELPDFLKNKENDKLTDDKKRRKSRGTSLNREYSKFYDSEDEKQLIERCFDNSCNLDGTVIEAEKTLVLENGNRQQTDSTKERNQSIVSQISPIKLSKPPPLPPKPKSLSNSLRSNVLPSRPFQRMNFDKKTI